MRIIEKSQYSIENVQEQQFSLILSRKAISVSELFLKTQRLNENLMVLHTFLRLDWSRSVTKSVTKHKRQILNVFFCRTSNRRNSKSSLGLPLGEPVNVSPRKTQAAFSGRFSFVRTDRPDPGWSGHFNDEIGFSKEFLLKNHLLYSL